MNNLENALSIQASLNSFRAERKDVTGKLNAAEFSQYCYLIAHCVATSPNAAVRKKIGAQLVAAGRSENNVKNVLAIMNNAKVKKIAASGKFDEVVANFAAADIQSVSALRRLTQIEKKASERAYDAARAALEELGVAEDYIDAHADKVALAIDKAIAEAAKALKEDASKD